MSGRKSPSLEPHPPAVDARNGPFILTGSAVPADDISRHTGAGQFYWIRVRPMTLFELGHSSGLVCLSKLLDGENTSVNAGEFSLTELAEIACIGGWPGLVGSGSDDARRLLRSYLDSVARTDIRRVDGVARDPQEVWQVLQSLARNIGTEAAIATIARYAGGSEGPVDADIVTSYLGALERLMVVEDRLAWAPRAVAGQAALGTETAFL
jgi:predicted AAA+ superfamily ATPase